MVQPTAFIAVGFFCGLLRGGRGARTVYIQRPGAAQSLPPGTHSGNAQATAFAETAMTDTSSPHLPHWPGGLDAAELSALQARIDQAQALFREWTQLLPRLQEAQADWQRGEQIMRVLADFYFNGDYMRGVNAMEGGASFRLETPGEHSVMAEDTLWNAFHEQQALAWQRLRAAIDVLDRRGGGVAADDASDLPEPGPQSSPGIG